MSTTSPLATLRPAVPADDSFLRELFHAVHAPEFAALAMAPQALEPLLDMQLRGQRTTYAAHYPQAAGYILEFAGAPVGRLLVAFQPEAVHLVDIALLPGARGQGIGTGVLAWLNAQADALRLPIVLQVRPDNPAARLYQRLGFVQTGGDSANLALERATATPAEATAQTFRELQGSPVHCLLEDGTWLVLVVGEVHRLPFAAAGDDPELSFTVEFTGPPLPEFDSTLARLFTEDRRTLELFLSATGAGPQGRKYEAVFNRSQPPAPISPE